MIHLEPFRKEDYATLISQIPDAAMLMQFAGPLFTFPLTAEQLDEAAANKDRFPFKVIDTASGNTIGHGELFRKERTAHLGRIFVFDAAQRGKGIGRQIIQQLLEFAFAHLDRTIASLNVYDWNTGAIKCYEKLGFTFLPEKKSVQEINGVAWVSLHMTLEQAVWETKTIRT